MTDSFLAGLLHALPAGTVSIEPADLAACAVDQGPVVDHQLPIAVVRAQTVEDVQMVMRAAHAAGVPVVCRGAGTGVSGGAHATEGCLVLNLERMDRILEIHPEDEIARVEPGVINSELNAAVAEYGLMYAPDPASYRLSTIGGNIATNAGGLRCAKYGVTRESVLALDVVLADGTLIRTGRRTFKGVAGYDLTGLFVGSEGTLGVVVGATVRLRYLPAAVETVAAFFPDVAAAAAGVLAVGRARVQPAIMELLDGHTMAQLDKEQGSSLRSRGAALLLIQTDGYGAAVEAGIIREVLSGLGGDIKAADAAEAVRLVDLRRHSRGAEVDDDFRVGEDVAVPRSQLVHYIHQLQEIAERHGVGLKVVAHAGDGNLHPTFWVGPGDVTKVPALNAALDESIDVGLALGGTITGEHGVGQYKVRWLGREQSEEVLELQRRLKDVFDPQRLLNPGKALPVGPARRLVP
ncbi:MAG: FAD-binding oxidoreductase [Actinomycetota bacterium]